MDIETSDEERAFRARVAEWLRANVPAQPQPQRGTEMRDFDLAWQRAQYDGGWAGISWPSEFGGRGLSLRDQLIWYEEYAKSGAPDAGVCSVGLNHAGPTLIACATEEQQRAHLPKILRGEVVWAQGFSEPEAGSDLASIATRGVVDGDSIVVTGQKVWTSYADFADFQELVVRTSHGQRRHDGLTWLICDMRSPGITVRPLPTMVGTAHFCQVFYDEVRIPLTNVVGEVDDGWPIAMSTLSFERGTGFMKEQVRLSHEIESLIRMAESTKRGVGRALIDDEHVARRLATARSEAQALRAMTIAAVSRSAAAAGAPASRSTQPGPYGSMLRLFYGELHQRVTRLALDILGMDGLAASEFGTPDAWSAAYLTSFADTIAAGTKDIQRTIIAERLLGLPKGG